MEARFRAIKFDPPRWKGRTWFTWGVIDTVTGRTPQRYWTKYRATAFRHAEFANSYLKWKEELRSTSRS